MVKVYKQKAGKDYPEHGIKKGDTYYSWTPGFRGRLQRSKTYPKASQQTANPFLQAVYGAAESLEDFTGGADDLREIAASVREAGEEVQSSFDNMPEGLQQGDTGQMLEQRATAASEWADQIDEAADTLEEKLTEIERLRDLKQKIEDGEAASDEWDGEEDMEEWDADAAEEDAAKEAGEEALENQPDWG